MAEKKPIKIQDQPWYSDPDLRAKRFGIGKDSDHPQGDDRPSLVKCPRCEQMHWVVTSAKRVYCRACRQSKTFSEESYIQEYSLAD